jgi:hypothetical protein
LSDQMTVCDLSLGSVNVTNDNLSCNNTATSSPVTSFTVIGSSSSYQICIRNSTVTVSLSDLSITSRSASAVTVVNSRVSFQFVGSNRIATSSESPSIMCELDSRLSFSSPDQSSLLSLFPHSSIAIGSPPGSNCNEIEFFNGSYFVNGSGGIGSSLNSLINGSSKVSALTFHGGRFNISTTDSPGIGSGQVWSNGTFLSYVGAITIHDGFYSISAPTAIGSGGASEVNATSSVENITIENGWFDLVSLEGAAIGAGWAEIGFSSVGTISVLNGTFRATSFGGAGIGAGPARHDGRSTVGGIEIKNGFYTISAVNGSAIGAGSSDNAYSVVNSVVVQAGSFDINATNAAGIGGGFGHYGPADCATIQIYNGTFQIASSQGAGIGAGYGFFGTVFVNTIEIRDGWFNLTVSQASGIGSGMALMGTSRVSSALVISGGRFHIASDGGAGIGSGPGQQGTSSVAVVNISNAHMSITANLAAGIGSGYADGGQTFVDRIYIANGTFLATALIYGSAIGGGYAWIDGTSNVSSIVIASGDFELTGSQASGIGSGSAYAGNSNVRNVEILEGTFKIETTWGAAIGAGDSYVGLSSVGRLEIRGGNYIAAGKTGIGSTAAASIDEIILSNSIDLQCMPELDWCINGSRVNASDLVLQADVDASTLITTNFSSGSVIDLEVQFLLSSYPDNLTIPTLHIGELKGFDSDIALEIRSTSGWNRIVNFAGGRAIGIMLSIPGDGEYSISYHSADGKSGSLCCEKGETFKIEPLNHFFNVVEECQPDAALSRGAIIGIALGGVALITIAILIPVVIIRKRRAAQAQPALKYNLPADEDDSPDRNSATPTQKIGKKEEINVF